MRRPPVPRRFRLIDGVLIAAVALLSLKTLGLLAGGASQKVEPPSDGHELGSFGRILAHARSNHVPADPLTTGSIPDKTKPAPGAEVVTAAIKTPSLIPPSPTERALLDRLGDRRDALQQREREMEARESLLAEQERRLEERLGQSRTREEGERKAGGVGPDGESAALKNLVVMYESMKPKEAARVFDRLPLDILVPVVTRMNSRKMAEVLATMSPESAEKLTVALARRGQVRSDGPLPASGSPLPPGELPAIELPAQRR